MNIVETYISFTGLVNVGLYAFFINVDETGAFTEIEDIVKQAMHFNRVVLYGEEIFKQREDVATLISKLVKYNTEIKIELHTTGCIRPIKISKQQNVEFFVHVPLKKSGIEYNTRIKPSIISWFNLANAKFLFNIENQEDIEEASLIIITNMINKSQVYLYAKNEATDEQLDCILKHAKQNEYNFTLNYKKLFWNKFGKYKEEQK